MTTLRDYVAAGHVLDGEPLGYVPPSLRIPSEDADVEIAKVVERLARKAPRAIVERHGDELRVTDGRFRARFAVTGAVKRTPKRPLWLKRSLPAKSAFDIGDLVVRDGVGVILTEPRAVMMFESPLDWADGIYTADNHKIGDAPDKLPRVADVIVRASEVVAVEGYDRAALKEIARKAEEVVMVETRDGGELWASAAGLRLRIGTVEREVRGGFSGDLLRCLLLKTAKELTILLHKKHEPTLVIGDGRDALAALAGRKED